MSKWSKEWKGQCFYSHGDSNKCGVMSLIGKNVDFKLIDKACDNNGRLLMLHCSIHGEQFILTNSYAPNVEKEQLLFWDEVPTASCSFQASCSNIVWGGDFNCCLTPADTDDHKYKAKVRSISTIESFLEDFILCNIWRVRNQNVREFTWRTFNPPVQRRLDYIFISNHLQTLIKKVKILSSFQSDHSTVILNRMLKQGLSYWKFNTSLINDKHYNDKLENLINSCTASFENKEDPSALWEYVKFKISAFTISYSKNMSVHGLCATTMTVGPTFSGDNELCVL